MMSDPLSVGGYGVPPLGTTRPTPDHSHEEAKREPPSDSAAERKEPPDKKKPETKRPSNDGVGDHIDVEA